MASRRPTTRRIALFVAITAGATSTTSLPSPASAQTAPSSAAGTPSGPATTPGAIASTAVTAVTPTLTLDQALGQFRTSGFDVVLADIAVRSAEADVKTAGAIANPAFTLGYGRVLHYDPTTPPCDGCSANQYTVGVSEQGALFDALTGKRGLRKDVAKAALAAARMNRADARRLLEHQVKQDYLQLLLAQLALDFATEVQARMEKTLELQRLRYPKVIDEGDLARFEIQKLQADQSVDLARQDLAAARSDLAFLLGERGAAPAYVADPKLFDKAPTAYDGAALDRLLALARAHRPDLRAYDAQRERAQASLDLAHRNVFPDVALSVQYAQTGTGQNAIQPPTVSVAATLPLPLFYQQQGEIARAEADRDAQTVLRRKTEAQIAADVRAAFSAYVTSRDVVRRMETSLLDAAKRSRDIVDAQYAAGSATLLEYLDAERTFISTHFDYLAALGRFWSAVFQLETAVGTEIRG